MKNNKGMTLIEVIVAIFLIGLIASTFLPSIMSSFTIMKKGKTMTEDTFKTQQNIELAMEQIRDKIDEKLSDPSKTDPRDVSITAFGKTIKGKSIVEPIVGGNTNIYSFIASGHVVEENMPQVSSIKLDQLAPTVILVPKQVYGANSAIRLKGDHSMVSITNYFTDLKRWYKSKEGYDGFIPNTVTNESDWGTRYPSWPNDYELIKDIDANVLSMKDEFIGRHVVYSVIPVSKTGRYGIETGSNPVYINGPPILTNLSLHLDTYVLDKADGEQFKSWNDISGNNINASTTGNGVKLYFNNGKYANFDKSTLTFNKTITNSQDITMFIVLSNPLTKSNLNQEIINRSNTNNGWDLKLNNGKLEFIIKNGNRSVKSDNDLDENMHIITIKATRNNIKMIMDKNDNTEIKTTSTPTNISFNSNSIKPTIGNTNSDLNISEVIFYSTELSDNDIDKIRLYLSKKHRIDLVL